MTRLVKCADCARTLVASEAWGLYCKRCTLAILRKGTERPTYAEEVFAKKKRKLVGEAWAVRRGSEWLVIDDEEFAYWRAHRVLRTLFFDRACAAAELHKFAGARLVRVRFFEVRR